MYKNFKVVANTAVGRRQYLKLLLPQVLASDIVDRYDLWVNTLNKVDIAFFEAMAKQFPKLNLIWQPNNEVNGILSIADFYQYCQDEDTIYIKLDDDVIWMAPNFFEEICKFRIDHPDYFLVSPLVINNGICTYLIENQGHIKFSQHFTCQAYDMKFYNGSLAEDIHNYFLTNFLLPNKYSELYCGHHRISLQRFAINAVAWFGHDFKKFNGMVTGDDEEFLTLTYPAKHDLLNCFDCNTIVAHFSFSAQRQYLDKTDILSKYENILNKSTNKTLIDIIKKTTDILSSINSQQQDINSRPIPHGYTQGINKPLKNEFIKRCFEFFFGILRIPKAHRRNFTSLYLSTIVPKRKYFTPQR